MALKLLNTDHLESIAKARRPDFEKAEPFQHVVIDDLLPADLAERVRKEFEQAHDEWDHYTHYNERKLAITTPELLGPTTRAVVEELQSDDFLHFLEMITGIEGLIADPHLDGAGMHLTRPGGHLNIHTDFLAHPIQTTWSRKINMIIYFNHDWVDEWNGNLEIWDSGMTRAVHSVLPSFNRCVLFKTSRHSLHGHPKPLACPEGDSRKSLALYYFRDEHARRDLQPTAYFARPEDSFTKKLLIVADTAVIGLYSILRRYAGVKDGLVSRLLRYF
ncbi:MAG: 2OG-Fe(II) oxygenase [Deltaproteobacteria bacterium]|nr:2OG-Fe(II) oxygenase [Deltaproteobacteria bacterium]